MALGSSRLQRNDKQGIKYQKNKRGASKGLKFQKFNRYSYQILRGTS